MKYCRNRCDCSWAEGDDPFRWRGSLPLARWGLAELQLMGWPLLALTVLAARFCWYLAPLPAAALALVVYFFRDPPRRVPEEPGLVVSPADGTIAEITRLEQDEFIGGPAVRIGIFLSIFNVHLNRAPLAGRVIAPALLAGRIPQRPAAGKRAAEREHVDRPGGGAAAPSAAGGAADFRGHRAADRLRPAAGRGRWSAGRSSA